MTVSGTYSSADSGILELAAPADSDDIKVVDLTKVHNLSGPIAVEGAEPGDCLVVDILDGVYFPPYSYQTVVR